MNIYFLWIIYKRKKINSIQREWPNFFCCKKKQRNINKKSFLKEKKSIGETIRCGLEMIFHFKLRIKNLKKNWKKTWKSKCVIYYIY